MKKIILIYIKILDFYMIDLHREIGTTLILWNNFGIFSSLDLKIQDHVVIDDKEKA